MDVISGHRRIDRALRAPAVAVGNFDGVHVGHQQLVARARAAADRLGGEVVVLTFDPHPMRVLAPDRAPRMLSTIARRMELLAAAGADACVVEPFDAGFASLSPEAFAEGVLSAAIGARHVVVGHDFAFGHQRQGNTELLRRLGDRLGFAVNVVDPVTVDGVIASSSRIRSLVEAGDLDGARALLGRDFDVDGAVVRGAGRGRGIGVPTANVAPEGEILPALGIYACWVELAGEPPRPGAASVGTNPTFDSSGSLSVEVHILDFDRDIYGERVRLAFAARLRGEEKFPGAAELVEQIRRDIADTRRVLGA